jgi:5S rRNA maturation endonuclease (ribonuclease M5)
MNPKALQRFEEFLIVFVRELNELSEEGGVVLVEGKRDLIALQNLGYNGKTVSIASLRHRSYRGLLAKAKTVVILTDLDREGRQLAARYVKLLKHDGIEPSLEYRKRLLIASRNTFLHIENLRRFSHLNRELA